MVSFKECRSKLKENYFALSFLDLNQDKVKDMLLNNNQNKTTILQNKYTNPWSLAKVEDELVLHLSSYAEEEILDENPILIRHLYQEEAQFLLYRINLVRPTPEFIIFEPLLPPKLKQELIEIRKSDIDQFNDVVTKASKRLYESINFEYFHTSGVGGKIYWRIVP